MKNKSIVKKYYREKKYICGDYIDIQIFPVHPISRSRKERRRPTKAVQEKLNAKNARRQLLRTVRANFKNGDIFMTLTYTEKNITDNIEKAKRDIQNFFRRMKRLYKKSEKELKYVWIMERAKKTGRIHFHIFCSGGVDRDAIEKTWGLGWANSRSLVFDETGLSGLVYYVTKDMPLMYRRWSCSKNMKKPVERQNDSRISASKAKKLHDTVEYIDNFKKEYPQYDKLLKEYEIMDITAQHNNINGDYYLFVQLYKRKHERR